MKKVLFGLLMIAGCCCFSQKGQSFPYIGGTTLDGKYMELPLKNNKFSVIGIAYNRAAEKDMKEWLNPLYSTFMKKGNDGAFDIAEIYDVNFIFIPMISAFKTAENEFKKGTDKEFWPYIMDASTDIKTIKQTLKIEDDKIPYFYVVDKAGKIVTVASGKFTDEKMDKLEEAID